MKSTTVAVDLAKSVFQLAVADASWKVVETHRLTRSQFERWFHNRDVSLVVMEACGSTHHWARHLSGLGIEVKLLPAKYVRAYVKRNKTDAATALVAATSDEAGHYRDARHFASWFGLTPKEHSSGSKRHLGRISKLGDRYLRMLTHGAHAVLRSAVMARQAGRQVDGLKDWALRVQGRTNHNKAACALANKLARICYAVLKHHEPYGSQTRREENRKMNHTAYAVAD